MKLDPISKHIIRASYQELSAALRKVKQKSLKGKQLEDMKLLETAVQNLEVLAL